MVCCVIGGAIVAFLLARLRRLPLLGRFITQKQRYTVDPSNWRLDRREHPL